MNQSMFNVINEETRALLAKSVLEGMKSGSLRKTIDIATGLMGINLDAPAKQLVPLLSPFRQSIPRTVRAGSDASQWKAITKLSAPRLSSAARTAGRQQTHTVVSKSAAYKVMALGDDVSRESVAASEGFDPALAKATANCLLNYSKLEEIQILGGNTTAAIGVPAAPTVLGVATGGTIGAGTYTIRIFALALPAANRCTVGRTQDWDGTEAKINAYAITASPNTIAGLTDTDGVEAGSAESTTAALTGSTNSIRVAWTPTTGAAAYAVSVGLATGITNGSFQVIVTQSKITLTSYIALGTNVPGATTATSQDTLSYDGIITQLLAAGSGAYVKAVTDVLTADPAKGEIAQLADAMQSIYDNAKIGRLRILAGGQEVRTLTAKGVKMSAMQIFVSPSDPGAKSAVVFGAHVGEMINPITGDRCPVEALPWLPGGTIILLPMEIPYPDANASVPFDMAMGYDVERWDYASTAVTGPVYPFEVRSWGVPRAIFTGGCGILTDVFKG